MLSRRFHDDSRSILTLNSLQRQAINRFREKVDRGDYSFTDIRCLCGASHEEARLLSQKERHGLPVNVWLCNRCSLIYISPYFDAASVLRFYREDYRDIYDGLEQPTETFFEGQYRCGLESVQFIQKHLSNLSGMKVFEMGCGAGGNLKAFAEVGCQCGGCDIDPRFVTYGKSQGLELIQQDFLSLTNGVHQYDLVLMLQVLEHLPEPRTVLAQVKKLLSPKGMLYAEVPDVIPGNYLPGQLQNAHIWYFDLPTLDRFLLECGFEIVASESANCHLRILARTCVPALKSRLPTTPAKKKWRQFYWAEQSMVCRQAVGRVMKALIP